MEVDISVWIFLFYCLGHAGLLDICYNQNSDGLFICLAYFQINSIDNVSHFYFYTEMLCMYNMAFYFIEDNLHSIWAMGNFTQLSYTPIESVPVCGRARC